MNKPSETALQAAREIVMPENLPLKLKKLRIDQVATRIDAAAEAIVRERLAALKKLRPVIDAAVCSYSCLYDEDLHEVVHGEDCKVVRDALKGLAE